MNMTAMNKKIAIIGGGNIGCALVKGLLRSGKISASGIFLTRRKINMLDEFKGSGIQITADNLEAVKSSEIIIVAVLPSQLLNLLDTLTPVLVPGKHILVSVVTAFSIQEIKQRIGKNISVIRAMPNTAASVGQSMSCLAGYEDENTQLEVVRSLFDLFGCTLIIAENLISSATILGSCGIAFFMRYIRAASQGGIQVGFHAADAQLIAAQTALGATSLLLETGNHPEREIDKVTSPMGCTIAGLNEMEHNGLSSALIKGIVTSYNEINKLK
jgi:pyrroline-5-carboxylate reductase